MALTAVLSTIIGFLGGGIWEAFRSFNEEAVLSRHESALLTANRLRELPVRQSIYVSPCSTRNSFSVWPAVRMKNVQSI
jgi:hypothetical protein